MPANQLAKRITQTASAVNLKLYSDGVASPKQMKAVDEAIDKVGKAPIYTEHYVRGIDDLRSKARMMKRKHDIQVVVVDYLQLIPFDSKMSKHEGISQASHGIKQMAMELDVTVILLAQINRTGAMRDTGLVLYDLKDSGDIENDAKPDDRKRKPQASIANTHFRNILGFQPRKSPQGRVRSEWRQPRARERGAWRGQPDT